MPDTVSCEEQQLAGFGFQITKDRHYVVGSDDIIVDPFLGIPKRRRHNQALDVFKLLRDLRGWKTEPSKVTMEEKNSKDLTRIELLVVAFCFFFGQMLREALVDGEARR